MIIVLKKFEKLKIQSGTSQHFIEDDIEKFKKVCIFLNKLKFKKRKMFFCKRSFEVKWKLNVVFFLFQNGGTIIVATPGRLNEFLQRVPRSVKRLEVLNTYI